MDTWWWQRLATDWPALHLVERDGWHLGTSGGTSRRANSARAIHDAAPIEPVIEHYTTRGHTPCVQVGPGQQHLDQRLAAAGFETCGTTVLLARDTTPHHRPQPDVEIRDTPDARWDALNEPLGVTAESAAITARILAPADVGYAVHASGRARGCAVHAPSAGTVGIYALATEERARRQGLARQVLSALLAWGHARQASRAYLAVESVNRAALELYVQAGFHHVSRYHYRIRRMTSVS
ncbi:GNAT family N-acetyltransferase [Lipingzhangella sp. LS1_29]|uniref:GNAT family N-acetyltransferase n=1 Tax=Lipingzhangella rawalii TaxID=2055835 RepID=A0ABU2H486_9ACTN|nr:GNAT family N-acetyltransferase [Lipingzhangella rawalii]MDS1270108.1 GNAT family N-acetyltransferase [Lipingzhangella rawalii]